MLLSDLSQHGGVNAASTQILQDIYEDFRKHWEIAAFKLNSRKHGREHLETRHSYIDRMDGAVRGDNLQVPVRVLEKKHRIYNL